MKFMYSKKRVLSVFLSVLTVITVLTPAFSAWAGDVIGVYNIQLFYEDGNAVQDTDAEGNAYHETMKEGDTLQLSYKLIDCEIPDKGLQPAGLPHSDIPGSTAMSSGTARRPLWWMWTKMAWSRPLTPLRVL